MGSQGIQVGESSERVGREKQRPISNHPAFRQQWIRRRVSAARENPDVPIMPNWQSHHSAAELAGYARSYTAAMLADTCPCHRCKTPTPVVLLDSKPPPGADPDTADFTVLLCRPCYGPDWCPT